MRLSRMTLLLAVPLALLLWWGTGMLASAAPPELPGPVVAPYRPTAGATTTVPAAGPALPGAGPADTVVPLAPPTGPEPVVPSTSASTPPATTAVATTTLPEGARPVSPPVLLSQDDDDDDIDDIDDMDDVDGADDSDDTDDDDDDGVRDADG